MSLCRAINLFKAVNSVKKPICGHLIQQSRNSSALPHYRCSSYPPTKLQLFGANALQGFMWWWILWHLWHEPEHIYGEFPWPDSKKWTDEELGIPPDE